MQPESTDDVLIVVFLVAIMALVASPGLLLLGLFVDWHIPVMFITVLGTGLALFLWIIFLNHYIVRRIL